MEKKPVRLSARAVMEAASAGKLEEVRALIAAGAEEKHFVTKAMNAITEASYGDEGGLSVGEETRLAIIEELLHAGCPLEGQALFRPIDTQERKIFRFLIERGADVNAESPRARSSAVKGDTPLSVAVRHKRVEMARELLQAGADANRLVCWRLGGGGSTDRYPLYFATCGGDVEMVKLLLCAGAKVDARGPQDGESALQAAIDGGYPKVVEVLLEWGADPKKVRIEGGDPVRAAKEKERSRKAWVRGLA